MSDWWNWLLDEQNRTVLAFLGGGLVVLAGGIWKVVQWRSESRSKEPETVEPKSVNVTGGVYAGRDISRSPINIGVPPLGGAPASTGGRENAPEARR